MNLDDYMKNMEIKIKRKREEMIECALNFGFTAEETLQQSRELDELMNEYQRFFLNPKKKIIILISFFYLTKCPFMVNSNDL